VARKKKTRDVEYKVRSFRISDENYRWLLSLRSDQESWNKVFDRVKRYRGVSNG